MKQLEFLILVLVLCSEISAGPIPNTPNQTLLWNEFKELKTIGEFVVALTNNGLVVLEWSSTDQALVESNHFILEEVGEDFKLQGIYLIVRHSNDELTYFDITRLPQLEFLGTVYPPGEYDDFAQVGQDLFLSRWFDGLDWYRVTDFSSLEFLANEKSAIVATQLETQAQDLYLLDMYNGVIKYSLNSGFGNVVEKLLVDERPFNFNLVDSLIFIGTNSDGALIGKMNNSVGQIIGEVRNVPSPENIFPIVSGFVFLSPREINIISEFTNNSVKTFITDSQLTRGDFALTDSGQYLLLPRISGGITGLSLSKVDVRRQFLLRPGPITTILVRGNKLFTGGLGNPLESYEIINDSLHSPELLRGELTGVTDLEQSANLLYALYADEKKVIVFDMADISGTPLFIDSFSIAIDNALRLKMEDSLLLVYGRNQIEVHSEVLGEIVWDFDNPIVAVEVQNNTLYVTNRFGIVAAYTIQGDLSLSICAEMKLTGTGWAMESFKNGLFVFSGNILTSFTGCLELDTIIHLSSSVLDAAIRNETLYTVGPDCIAKYDLSSGIPTFVESGGLGASQISFDGGVMATTDGSAVHLYFEKSQAESNADLAESPRVLELHENFPEPFNSSTTIQFDLRSDSYVELTVYNLLGQRVRLLADEIFSSGRHSVSWDGYSQDGLESASGVYFYRLKTNQAVVSRKMMLLK